jgi:hypothetical protein
MKFLYPQFKVSRKNSLEVEFIGTLTVKPTFPVYLVSILYRGALSPLVRILEPKLVESPPHFYKNTGSLCLFHPANYKWAGGKILAKDIIPWTAAWIYFYEMWLRKGIWYGPEAPHSGVKEN